MIEAIRGAGVSDIIRVADEDSNTRKRLITVEYAFLVLSLMRMAS